MLRITTTRKLGWLRHRADQAESTLAATATQLETKADAHRATKGDLAAAESELAHLRSEAAQRAYDLDVAHCRLQLIRTRVERIAPGADPAGIGPDLIPWLDGPLHPGHLADYRGTVTATRP
ncbi:hypothetical protein ACIRPK_26550 [Kitasatospora sp. NPDC101801]|uniref:hypothetical protein n=1 Tax=Kitasatospora sp. NPDC101801 TaxID=3364103 RepID=UPI003819CD6B